MYATKLTPEILERAAKLSAEGLSRNQVRDQLLEEFGINVARSTLIEALQRHEDKHRREEAVKRIESEEAQLSADAARRVAATMAAEDLPEDAKLLQLRLAALVGRSNAAWEGMGVREKCASKTWAKLEDLTLKYLFLKFRIGGALTPSDSEMESVDKALVSKLESLAKKTTTT
jgi:hypothetical protein